MEHNGGGCQPVENSPRRLPPPSPIPFTPVILFPYSFHISPPDQRRERERERERVWGLVILSISPSLPACSSLSATDVCLPLFPANRRRRRRRIVAKQRENWKMTRISSCSQDFDFRSLISDSCPSFCARFEERLRLAFSIFRNLEGKLSLVEKCCLINVKI